MVQDRNRFKKTYSFFKPPAVFATSGGGGGGGCCTPEFWFSTTPDAIFTTGSVLIRGDESFDSAEDFGTDNFFYVSGSIGASQGESHISVFGGDVVVSGSLTAFYGLSGSLTHLSDGTSYLVAGNGINISSASNGAVTVSALVGGGDVYTDSFTNANLSSGLLTVNHNLNAQYVNVSVYDNNDNLILPDEIIATSVGVTTLDLTSYGTIAGTWHVFIASGQAPFQEQYFFSTTTESIYTTGSTAFVGKESVDSPSDKGSDVFFYVSGSITGSASEDKKSLFGGDLVTSGSIFTHTFYAGSQEILRPSAAATIDASVMKHVTIIETIPGGTVTVKLDDGLRLGQQKYFVMYAYGDPAAITPLNLIGYSTVTLNSVGDSALLVWTSAGWAIISAYGAIVA